MGLFYVHAGWLIWCDEEVIGGSRLAEAVPHVDLDIAHSPVMPLPAGIQTARVQITSDGVDPETLTINPVNYQSVTMPCEAIRRHDQSYYLLKEGRDLRGRPWRDLETVSAEDLKVMRARYLLWKNYFYRLLSELGPGEMLLPNGFHQWVMRAFFPDGVYVIPLVMSRKLP